jgi:hypothetical protein
VVAASTEGSRSESATSFQARDAFVVVPAVLTASVGLLYGAGAIIKSGQLRGAGLDVRDTITLVPLEQILALGIGTIVTSLIWVAIFASYLVIFLAVGPPKRSRPTSGTPRRKGRIFRRLTWGLLAFALILAFYNNPFFLAIVTSAGVLLGVAVAYFERHGRRAVFLVLLTYFVVVAAAYTGSAYVSPEPLPAVSLELRNEPTRVRGTLIVATGNTWYLSQARKTYRAVPAERVLTAVVVSQERENEPRPVLKVAFDWMRDKMTGE